MQSSANPPTAWTNWEGPLRPQAFDLNKLEGVSNTPWKAQRVMRNGALDFRFWKTSGKMDHLVSNGDAILTGYGGAREIQHYCIAYLEKFLYILY